MRPRRIVVPLDGHRASETALPTAVELARDSGGSLYLLTVLTAPAPADDAAVVYRAAGQHAERYLAATRERLAAEAAIGLRTAVWSGSPAAAIVAAADLVDADLIVMARGGATRPPPKLVGSVVEGVLRGTRRPVLVVTPADAVVDTSLGDAAPLAERAAAAARPGALGRDAAAGDRPASATAYLEAWRTLQDREREARRVVATIHTAAKRLERWQAVHVAHAGAGFPKEVTMAGPVIDGTAWPTANELADALAAWHAAAEDARVAWRHVPSEARATLPPPP